MFFSIYRDVDDNGMATREGLLKFANALRQAGCADPISDLMPSTPRNSQSCLVANAVNFDTHVIYHDKKLGSYKMEFPFNASLDTVLNLAREVCCNTEITPGGFMSIILPEPINKVIAAFDAGEGWPASYRTDSWLLNG